MEFLIVMIFISIIFPIFVGLSFSKFGGVKEQKMIDSGWTSDEQGNLRLDKNKFFRRKEVREQIEKLKQDYVDKNN